MDFGSFCQRDIIYIVQDSVAEIQVLYHDS